jgi:hypothetical protein
MKVNVNSLTTQFRQYHGQFRQYHGSSVQNLNAYDLLFRSKLPPFPLFNPCTYEAPLHQTDEKAGKTIQNFINNPSHQLLPSFGKIEAMTPLATYHGLFHPSLSKEAPQTPSSGQPDKNHCPKGESIISSDSSQKFSFDMPSPLPLTAALVGIFLAAKKYKDIKAENEEEEDLLAEELLSRSPDVIVPDPEKRPLEEHEIADLPALAPKDSSSKQKLCDTIATICGAIGATIAITLFLSGVMPSGNIRATTSLTPSGNTIA